MAGLRNSKHFPLYSHVLIVGPEHARTFADGEWSKDDLTRHIHERARKRIGRSCPMRTTARARTCAPPRATRVPTPDAMIAKFASMEEIHVVVADGTAGRFSVAIPPTAQQAKRLAPGHARGGTNPLTSVQVHVILLAGSGTNGVR